MAQIPAEESCVIETKYSHRGKSSNGLVLFAPIGLFVSFTATSLMEGKNPLPKVQESLILAYKVNLMGWPWVQFVNFTLTSLHYRLFFVKTASIGRYSRHRKFFILLTSRH